MYRGGREFEPPGRLKKKFACWREIANFVVRLKGYEAVEESGQSSQGVPTFFGRALSVLAFY